MRTDLSHRATPFRTSAAGAHTASSLELSQSRPPVDRHPARIEELIALFGLTYLLSLSLLQTPEPQLFLEPLANFLLSLIFLLRRYIIDVL
ncbi:hypothetical protein F4781DRAFT_365923 [Annulohypoxylon bovei var. microspora]|nr:hypothetical protein F4781DRAFT_365923 [Annulohypoxylon bovei var. microspora]